MLVNRDEIHPHTVRVQFEDSKSNQIELFSGPVSFVTFQPDRSTAAGQSCPSQSQRAFSVRLVIVYHDASRLNL
jgi:hypothetical protein